MSDLRPYVTPSERSAKRRKLQEATTPATECDSSYYSCDDDDDDDSWATGGSDLQIEDEEGPENLLQRLTEDTLGTIFFGGFLNSFEVVKSASCVSKEMIELAKMQVKMLDLRKCPQLTNSKLEIVARRFAHLTELDLSYCPQISSIDHLRHLRLLKILKLRGTSVSDVGMASWLRHPSSGCLEVLDLSAVAVGQSRLITDRTANLLANHCPHLKSLNLAWCRGITDAGVEHLSKLRDIVDLDLQLTSVTDESCKFLASFTKLEKLELSACDIGDIGLINLLPDKSISNLKQLNLRFNVNLNETSLKRLLTRTPNLEVLNLECCEIERTSLRGVFLRLQRRGVKIQVDQYIAGVPEI